MTAANVLEVLDRLASCGVEVWIDGGWGVDALIGRETRPHGDLDVVVALEGVEAIRRALEPLGFSVLEDELPTRFVMRHADDRRVDFHTVSFDAEGGGIQVQQDGSRFRYTPEGLGAAGSVGSRAVRCISPELQLLCHRGYDPDETDRHDVRLLCRRFGLAAPESYEP